MAYFKIGSNDYSSLCSGLKIKSNVLYNSQTNAAGTTVADYINTKRTIEVEIIPLDAAAMLQLQLDIKAFNVSLSFMNPQTNTLEENVACIIPSHEVKYYTIQANKTMFDAVSLTFTEL